MNSRSFGRRPGMNLGKQPATMLEKGSEYGMRQICTFSGGRENKDGGSRLEHYPKRTDNYIWTRPYMVRATVKCPEIWENQ